MADRVKYLLLGLLFLVVAGVIAYDRWNPAGEELIEARGAGADGARVFVDTGKDLGGINDRGLPQSGNSLSAAGGSSRDATDGSGDPADGRLDGRSAERQPRGLRIDIDDPGGKPSSTPASPPRVLPTTPPQNQLSPVRPEPAAPVPAAPRSAQTHVVQPGETLERISLDYYGSVRGVAWIMDANEIENANRIFAKQKLVIPAAREGGTSPRPVANPSARTDLTATVPSAYVVRQGDGDLYAICKRFYGTQGLPARVHQVMSLNGLWSKDVAVGSRLQLPGR